MDKIEEPTVGRKVWFWSKDTRHCLNVGIPFDATVLYPTGARSVDGAPIVNLSVRAHNGMQFNAMGVSLYNPAQLGDQHGFVLFPGDHYATWMPYQTRKQKEASS